MKIFTGENSVKAKANSLDSFDVEHLNPLQEYRKGEKRRGTLLSPFPLNFPLSRLRFLTVARGLFMSLMQVFYTLHNLNLHTRL